MKARFGAAGNPESFYAAGFKKSIEMPEYLSNLGLSAYEYQSSRGVRISEKTAQEIGMMAQQHNIRLSMHAPYYINLASEDPKIMESSKGHLLKALQAARWMGAEVVVFHPGGAAKMERQVAMDRAKKLFTEILKEVEQLNLADIYLAPETMGKQNQLGTLTEVLELCQLGQQVIPCVDFGHLHALSGGGFDVSEAYEEALDEIEAVMGKAGEFPFHMHFSPMEYTKAGEKRHRTLLDEGYGPNFAPLAKLLAHRKHDFTLICESAGRQAEDALAYRNIFLAEV